MSSKLFGDDSASREMQQGVKDMQKAIGNVREMNAQLREWAIRRYCAHCGRRIGGDPLSCPNCHKDLDGSTRTEIRKSSMSFPKFFIHYSQMLLGKEMGCLGWLCLISVIGIPVVLLVNILEWVCFKTGQWKIPEGIVLVDDFSDSFSVARVKTFLDDGQGVLVFFANLANKKEQNTLHALLQADLGGPVLVADVSERSKEIKAEMRRFRRSRTPFYAAYIPGADEPVVASDPEMLGQEIAKRAQSI